MINKCGYSCSAEVKEPSLEKEEIIHKDHKFLSNRFFVYLGTGFPGILVSSSFSRAASLVLVGAAL
jgi:hypothetical protein